MPLAEQALGVAADLLLPVELEADRPVPVDPEPAQRALDLIDGLGDLAPGVGVLDPQPALSPRPRAKSQLKRKVRTPPT